MKKIILTIALMLLFAVTANAQMKLIAVQHNGTVNFYQGFCVAADYAQSGDTIILPGGNFHCIGEGFYIHDKEVHIFGVGHYPDATTGTDGPTIFVNGLELGPGTDNSTVSGIVFTKEVIISANNITISRCIFQDLLRFSVANYFKCSESVLQSIYGQRSGGVPPAENAIFERNIIAGWVGVFNYAIFDHNIFTYYPGTDINWGTGMSDAGVNFWAVNSSLFTNNIFTKPNSDRILMYIWWCEGNIFQNNIFAGELTFPFGGTYNNTGTSNLVGVNMNDIFNNFGSDFNSFKYTNNYYVKDSYSNRLHTTDGTEIGIYGTSYPYKEEAVPIIPHYTNCSIPGQLDGGILKIEATVEAQTK